MSNPRASITSAAIARAAPAAKSNGSGALSVAAGTKIAATNAAVATPEIKTVPRPKRP